MRWNLRLGIKRTICSVPPGGPTKGQRRSAKVHEGPLFFVWQSLLEKVSSTIEDTLRGRTDARRPLVDVHGLCRRPLWLSIGIVLDAIGRILVALEGTLGGVSESSWQRLRGVLEVLGGHVEPRSRQEDPGT